MVLQRGQTRRDGERVGYYRWGDDGEMYTYERGDVVAAAEARHRARLDGIDDRLASE